MLISQLSEEKPKLNTPPHPDYILVSFRNPSR